MLCIAGDPPGHRTSPYCPSVQKPWDSWSLGCLQPYYIWLNLRGWTQLGRSPPKSPHSIAIAPALGQNSGPQQRSLLSTEQPLSWGRSLVLRAHGWLLARPCSTTLWPPGISGKPRPPPCPKRCESTGGVHRADPGSLLGQLQSSPSAAEARG